MQLNCWPAPLLWLFLPPVAGARFRGLTLRERKLTLGNILIIQRFALAPKRIQSCLHINRVPLQEQSIIDCTSQSYRCLAVTNHSREKANMSITISVLLENRLNPGSKNLLRAKAGLSLLIHDENDSILFDTGPDDSFMHNAGIMGLDLTNLTATVLSHGHYDHCGGVPWLPDTCRIICHPMVASERYSAVRFSGHTARIKKLSLHNDYSRYRMEYSSAPLHIGERFMWSGEIPVAKPRAYGVVGSKNAKADYVKDEGVLIYKSDCGLIIFIGCGHRGLIDIVRHCQNITGINHIHALFGGFHLRCASPLRLWKVRQFLHIHKPDKIMGCHCTGKWGCLWLPEAVSPATGDVYVLG